jgi:hypothetical protein
MCFGLAPSTCPGEGNKRKRSGQMSLDLWADPGRVAQKLAQVRNRTASSTSYSSLVGTVVGRQGSVLPIHLRISNTGVCWCLYTILVMHCAVWPCPCRPLPSWML